ncbi:MAG: cupin [Gammaproteobacteria bacterium]|nr:cupin [Gammaproteobacteria bacterium]
MNRTEFEQKAIADGYQEPVEVTHPAEMSREPHSHGFDARLLVLGGELRIGIDGNSRRYLPGEVCQVGAGTMHSEQTGRAGVRLLVARR